MAGLRVARLRGLLGLRLGTQCCQLQRSITVRAMRELKKSEALAKARATQAQEPPTTSRQADPYAPKLFDRSLDYSPAVQRTMAVLRRALDDQNLLAAISSLRVLQRDRAMGALTNEEFHEFSRQLCAKQGAASGVPKLEELDMWETLLRSFVASREAAECAVMSDILHRMLLEFRSRKEDTEGIATLWRHMIKTGVRPKIQTYNILIKHYAREGLPGQAEEVFAELMLRSDIEPSAVTFANMIKARSASKDSKGSRALVDQWLQAHDRPEIKLLNAMLLVYKRNRDLESLTHLWQATKRSKIPLETITFNTVLDGYVKEGLFDKAMEVLQDLKQYVSDHPDESCRLTEVPYNILINAFGKEGRMDDARTVFSDLLSMELRPDIVTFTSLMDGYGRLGDVDSVKTCYAMLQDHNLQPTAPTFSVLIYAFGMTGDMISAVDAYHQMLSLNIPPSRSVFRALIRVHAKAGDVVGAEAFYKDMSDRHITPDGASILALMEAHLRSAEPADVRCSHVRKYYKEAQRFGRLQDKIFEVMERAELEASIIAAKRDDTPSS
ncbi:hypothetical protein DFS34DRAFT_592326 [Phlyctochytrium arcticum]|nr:hypothetical protein DFS34DRAFT_592326 [Phlyctochytrium arcticum]